MSAAGKTYRISKPNGEFVFLLDYETEDDLDKVLALVEERLGVSFPPPSSGPYSSYASTEYQGHVLTAAADSNGCYLRLEPGHEGAANEIATLL